MKWLICGCCHKRFDVDGILAHLREGCPEMKPETSELERALQRGVTITAKERAKADSLEKLLRSDLKRIEEGFCDPDPV